MDYITMSICYTILKYTGLLCNFLYMLLGIGIILGAGWGLHLANPNSAEHTYFIESIILGGMICMIVIFGCYGLFTDLLVVNIIFSTFILLILAVQYVQMQSYQPRNFQKEAIDYLDNAWLELENKPHLMQRIEVNYKCCGYYNEQDYKNLLLLKPTTCYQQLLAGDMTMLHPRGCLTALNTSYPLTARREILLNYITIVFELFILTLTMAQSVLVYKLKLYRRSDYMEPALASPRQPTLNHIDSHTHLLALNV